MSTELPGDITIKDANGVYFHLKREGDKWSALISFDGLVWTPLAHALTQARTNRAQPHSSRCTGRTD